ncbi:type II toxin-antitoxin system RelE/ParE family toxin [Tahibacter soli]|jgi:toxin ParE1/3/4|uniref:Type II toxin-antitoxin system RelE/ParE family toxin n=1 Tax=Tahibacter soli TaxID=2983605 RepID=A0A9X3YP38_9GAMM|nr:type II toxin-antitoxin system RelE/ParE family toxin [Tahibacter soli]MDC8015876.1 type II toxin-antitoxin system RelE/ParE family toxin [Tahibacter soli]
MSRFAVVVTDDAKQDLLEIYDYIETYDCIEHADHVVDRLVKVIESLSQTPERGSHPRELLALGIRDYRQATFKPYRAIYGIDDRRVVVYLIADGRRNLQTLLARRLLGA